uniref:Adenylyl cyclase-associated protein n=1 Tax=Anopheles dirus TaxID=7168 RepID=A0A182N8M7_9DIPT
MFSCCRCVNPKSPKLKEKSASGGKGGSDKLSDSEDSHEEEEQQSKQQNETTNASACKISAVDNLSQDDEEIKIEIIESSDNLQSYSGCSAATTAVLNGSSPEPKEAEGGVPVADSQRDPSSSASPVDTQPAAASSLDDEQSPNLASPTDGDEKAADDSATDIIPTVATGSASSSPASKTLSSTDRGQTDDQSGLSSGAITEIEAKLPNESTDADSTGDATNTPQEIPTTIGELVAEQEENNQTTPAEDGDAISKCSSPSPVEGETAKDVFEPVPKSPTHEPARENANEARAAFSTPAGGNVDLSSAEVKQEQQPPAAQDDEAEERVLTEDTSIEYNTGVRDEQTENKSHLNEVHIEGEESQTNDNASTPHTANVPDEEPSAESMEPPPPSSVYDEASEVADEQQHASFVASKTMRLKSEPSNSEETIEETIDVKRFLPDQPDDSKSDDDNPLSSSSGEGVSVEVSTVPDDTIDIDNEPESAGVKGDHRSDESIAASACKAAERSDREDGGGADSLTPSPPDAMTAGSPEVERDDEEMETAANHAVGNGNDQVSKNSNEGRESNNDDTTSTLSESVPNTATNGGSPSGIEDSSSRKESVNSDDTTIRTQVSFRESCLSRRSSSKSSIKKKVAYNDSTEVIPPPEYPPPDDDDSVFSDSVPPKLPRGDMCTPYATKRGSLPGMIALPDWFAEDRLMMEEGGIMEPPTTPIGRDELALRRHRFFSELLNAAHAAVEHRVRFDPLGPEIAKVPSEQESEDCDPDLKPSSARELECLIDRLERIVDRLERTVSARELEETRRILKDACVVGKAVIRSNTGTNTDHRAPSVRNDVAADVDNDDLPTVLPSTPPPSASYLHQQVDSLESSLFPELTDQPNHRELATVIHPKPTAILTHTNQLTTQEQGNAAVLSIYSSQQHGTGAANKMSINAYEDIMLGSFANFIALSSKIGGDVATQAQFVKEAFDAQFAFLKVAAASSAPSNTDLQTLLKPTSDKIATIQSFREKNRTSPFFNHLSAISESIPALGWVCVAPTPGPYVKEMNDAGQFYTNRVLKDWKEKDSTHVEWARGWIQTLTELQQYIKQHHTTGLVWSGKDKPTTGGASVPPPPPPGGLPPPPPMMPLADLSAGGVGDDRSALFAQINQGADITKGLKKVTADMQTHKNPGLRSGPAPYKAPVGVTNGTKSVAAPAVAKPPTFTRDGKKWLIEYQKNNAGLLVENAEMNNVVYMFRCEGSTLQIKGKINSVVMDSCKKCSLVFDSLVASAEFVNCQSVQMQVLGKVPTISIDKTDGCQMYLSADSLEVEIVSSKSSEMNVMIPKGASGDYTEQPIPEQFKTVVKGGSLNTTCVESLG